jgi:hypothetical protein
MRFDRQLLLALQRFAEQSLERFAWRAIGHIKP